MEQGGIIYWSELYPEVGALDGSDNRNVIIPDVIKYETIERIWTPLGGMLGFEASAWEEYDVTVDQLGILLDILKEARARDGSHAFVKWLNSTTKFVENAMLLKKALSVAL